MRSIITFAIVALVAAVLTPRLFEMGTKGTAANTAVAALPAGSRTVTLARDARGHFQADATVEGRRVNFLIDTGATVVALRESEAARLGYRPKPSDYTQQTKTANGTARAAPLRLNKVEVNGLVVHDVRAIVMPDEALSENLLGMAFLSRLRRFEYAGGKLVMEQ